MASMFGSSDDLATRHDLGLGRLLRLRAGIRRHDRTDRCGVDDRRTGPYVAGSQFFRNILSNSGYRHHPDRRCAVGRTRGLGPVIRSILAPMGIRIPHGGNRDAHGHSRQRCHSADRLRAHTGPLVLSDSVVAPDRDNKLSPLDPCSEPQQTLSGLLEFISPASADHLAEKLLDEFGSLPAIIGAERFRLETIDDVPDAALRLLALVGDAFRQSLSTQIINRPILSSSIDLMDYLRATIGYWRTECCRVLFLDAQNHLIRDEILHVGSVSKVVVDPRRILAQALRLDATALILVHNHPSGICQPSAADIAVTECLAESAALFDIAIHDHLIVAADGCASLKSLGIL